MYLKDEIAVLAKLIVTLETTLVEIAQKYKKVIIPGYTHLQRAQPILFAHHMLAYFWMLSRDFHRLEGVWEGTDIMPLGAGALAGTTFPIDRHFVAEELKFSKVYPNSLDAVSDRDYILEFLSFASILMMHLSRFSEELILWSSTEFNFIELDDAFATGSSMMPQKKNPDVPELVRGKTGRVYGHLMAMMTVAKGLPLAYNKDLQEDKEGLFDTIDTVKFSLTVYSSMLKTMKVNKERTYEVLQSDFSNATDMADYLVKKGLPFRQAHEVVGKAVKYAIDAKKTLSAMTIAEFQQFSPLFEADILDTLKIENCVAARDSYGGTSSVRVEQQITTSQEIIGQQQTKLDMYTKNKI